MPEHVALPHPHRYLLLEDVETGDMLMPLIYMKAVFEANYSRKLSRCAAKPGEAQHVMPLCTSRHFHPLIASAVLTVCCIVSLLGPPRKGGLSQKAPFHAASSLKNRLVIVPADVDLAVAKPSTYLYWQWAFESPQNVKLLVRQELGEDNAPQVRRCLRLCCILAGACLPGRMSCSAGVRGPCCPGWVHACLSAG